MKKIVSILLLLIAAFIGALSLSACSGDRLYREGSGELNVVCTIFPPFHFARNVGKDNITLTLLQDNGADLHNYVPTAATLVALSAADVFICVGGESDGWVEDAVSAANNPDMTVVKLTSLVTLTHAGLSGGEYYADTDITVDHDDHEHEHEGDEHVWTSLRNAINIVNAIADVFSEADAENGDYYRANAADYAAKLEELDNEYTEAFSSAARKNVVFADRFPFIYLLNDYGISYLAAFSGCSTEADASFETQATLTEAVKTDSLPAVITIEGNDKPLAESISRETGCEILQMNSMQSVVRAEITDGADYIEIMRNNLTVLSQALS